MENSDIPPLASWTITRRCLNKCIHCYVESSEFEDELNLDSRLQVLRRLKELNVRKVIIAGGEPLLLNDLDKIINSARRNDLMVHLVTTAKRLNSSILKTLRDNSVSVSVSVDGDASTHNAIRGDKDLELVFKGLGLLQKNEISTIISFTCMSLNYEKIHNVIMTASNYNARKVIIRRFIPLGRGRYYPLGIQPDTYYDLLKDFVKLQFKTKDVKLVFHDPIANVLMHEQGVKEVDVGCRAATAWFGILPNGDIVPCPLLCNQVLGNILKSSVNQITDKFFNNPSFATLRNRSHFPCNHCEHKSICGGCRAHSYAVFGDFEAPDPFCPVSKGFLGSKSNNNTRLA